MSKDYFFSNVEELIAYLYTKKETISPLKLQKGLYFLYAYYTAMFGFKDNDIQEMIEQTYDDLPAELFPAAFEAWYYGPVISQVHTKYRQGEDYYRNLAQNFKKGSYFKSESEKQVQAFIDKLFNTVLKSSDFGLVDRSHEDQAWKKTFAKGKASLIDTQSIIEEYETKFTR
ncbi:Panacea domain-containing protein [Psittacicella hinzii]|uniref:Antitoxin SocA-like Panacea domain-containing protein n=1 Tax=Psittacicella hinzii TaxID=2028575 RepID=A0A3A1YGT3_9GAMM|nr:type II toxin-antitoxin system antitoxin SocA domain-containing protein [Psittacicella hinzii]RIY36408.1 hypothetical protein CKF58_05955 [Psittacicella hinzii]